MFRQTPTFLFHVLVVAACASACGVSLPAAPAYIPPPAQTAPATIRLTAASRADHQFDVEATVLTADAHFVAAVPVTFSTSAGTIAPDLVTTNALGAARAVLSANGLSEIVATVGSVRASLNIQAPIAAAPQPLTVAIGLPGVAYTDRAVTLGMSASAIARAVWSFGDGSTETTAASSIVHTYTRSGNFPVSLTVTDSAGRTASDTQTLTVNAALTPSLPTPPSTPAPVVVATVDCTAAPHGTSTPCNVTATYNGNLMPSNLVTVTWDFGDGTVEGPISGPQRSHVYAQAGRFLVFVTVTVTTPDGARTGIGSNAIVVP